MAAITARKGFGIASVSSKNIPTSESRNNFANLSAKKGEA
jgi:hypothetical protein